MLVTDRHPAQLISHPPTRRRQELANRGHSPSAILDAVAEAPCPFEETFRRVMEGGSIEAVVVSDANEHFINHYLAAHELDGLISRVISNRSEIKDGALHVAAYHSHTCTRNAYPCAVNMCKGDIVLSLLNDKSYSKVWYVGDGSGDFCPAKILLEASRNADGPPLDVRIFCRRGWSLHRRLQLEYLDMLDAEERVCVEAQVVPWGVVEDGSSGDGRAHGDARDYAALATALRAARPQ